MAVFLVVVLAAALFPYGIDAWRARIAQGYAQQVASTLSRWALTLPGVTVAEAQAAWGTDCRYLSPKVVQGGGGVSFRLKAPAWVQACTVSFSSPTRVEVEVVAYGRTWRARSF